MNLENLSRKEKEDLYIKVAGDLEVRWGRSRFFDTEFMKDLSDQELVENINHISGQLRFEKGWNFLEKSIIYPICIFVVLGIIGLLIFGIKQLF